MQCSQIIKNINNTINDVNNVKFSLIQKNALNEALQALVSYRLMRQVIPL